jgi:SNF2 family DNA or RNA helicase
MDDDMNDAQLPPPDMEPDDDAFEEDAVDAFVEPDEDMEEHQDDHQEDAAQIIEQELEIEVGALEQADDDEATANEYEEVQEQDEFAMVGAQSETEPAQVGEDSSGMFVSPRASPAPPVSRHTIPSANMRPPPRQSAASSGPSISTFAKIRAMQKKLQEKKNAASKKAYASSFQATPDDEDYLAHVLKPITLSSSTPAPEVDEDEMAHRHASAEFQKQKRRFDDLRLQNGGTLLIHHDIKWMQVKAAEEVRCKKRSRDLAKARQNEDEDETALFPDIPRAAEEEKEDESDDEIDLDAAGPSRKRRRKEMPRKEPKQMSMQDAELHAMKVAMDADEDMPKKKRKAQPTDNDQQDARPTGKGKGKTAAKPKARVTRSKTAGKALKGGAKTAKAMRESNHALKQASSLFNSNVFEQQAGAHEREQPTFRARNKTDALKELIASVPLEDKKQAKSDIATLLAATKDFDGRGACKAHLGNWLLKGMKTTLKGYQVLGSAFMRRRENAAAEPKGGLMADQMGLGKTLMMLANIVNGQPPKGHYPRTTLLVASPSLLLQWAREIEQHTDCKLKVMRYGAGTRLDSNVAPEILKVHDIILTTYTEIMRSYPKNEPPIECQTAEQKLDWWKTTYERDRGPLHKMMFLRVVLDEAQAIKNHTGRTSIACRAVMAHHKWALSGTPILNSLTELYAYFKFLGVPHTGSFKIFKHNYCDTKDVENTERLLLRLSQFMIRRTHSDRLLNLPILKLPQANQGTFMCEFNPVERCIYDIVRQRFAKNINLWHQKGELEKSYSNALVMLLRLRQLTAHILMLQFVMQDLLEVEDLQLIKKAVEVEAAASETRSGRTVIAIRKQLERHAIAEKKRAASAQKKAADEAKNKAAGKSYEDAQIIPDEDAESPDAEEEGQDEDPSVETAQLGAGDGGSGKEFGKEFNFKPFLLSLKKGASWEKAKKKAKCSWCGEQPKDPLITSCGHLICATPCLDNSYIAAAEVGKHRAACKACGVTPTSIIPIDVDEDDDLDIVAQGTRSKGKRKAKQRERRDREDITDDWLASLGAEVLPSAKTTAVKAQILNWKRENPEVKVIVYTQFLAMFVFPGPFHGAN